MARVKKQRNKVEPTRCLECQEEMKATLIIDGLGGKGKMYWVCTGCDFSIAVNDYRKEYRKNPRKKKKTRGKLIRRDRWYL